MNVLTVNPEIPKNAGKAKIEWLAPDQSSLPRRDKNIIYLPAYQKAQFHKLAWGVQFLFVFHERSYGQLLVYFGGTDEEPFLVQLDSEVLSYYERGGEKGFYAALKPRVIKDLEEAFEVESERQGDIFGVPIPMSWELLGKSVKLYSALEGKGYDYEPEQVKDRAVFGTRHLFSGYELQIGLGKIESLIFGEGLIKAPDHADLILTRVHVFGQTSFLINPQKAD